MINNSYISYSLLFCLFFSLFFWFSYFLFVCLIICKTKTRGGEGMGDDDGVVIGLDTTKFFSLDKYDQLLLLFVSNFAWIRSLVSPRMNLCQSVQFLNNVIPMDKIEWFLKINYLIIRSTTDLTRDSVMLGTILASKSRTKSSVTPGLDLSAISKAWSNSSSGLLPLPPLPPRYLFDSCRTKCF